MFWKSNNDWEKEREKLSEKEKESTKNVFNTPEILIFDVCKRAVWILICTRGAAVNGVRLILRKSLTNPKSSADDCLLNANDFDGGNIWMFTPKKETGKKYMFFWIWLAYFCQFCDKKV